MSLKLVSANVAESKRQLLQDPYPYYAILRVSEPVCWSDLWGGWLVTRFDDVIAALQDVRLSSNRLGLVLNQIPQNARQSLGALETFMALMIGFADPPRHPRIRSIVQKALCPAVFENLRPRITEVVHGIIESFVGKEQIDLIQDLALPLPTTIIGEMLGVPHEHQAQMKAVSDRFIGLLGSGRADPESAQRTQESMLDLIDYFRDIVRARPSAADGVLANVLTTAESGELLSEDELLANCVGLLIGGHETTTNLIGNGMFALLSHPAEVQRLRSDPLLINTAVEEMLRYDSPLQRAIRVALEDLEIRDKKIRKGELVLAMMGSANRDPSHFPEPDRFDIRRSDNRHLAFGYGRRFCLGASLARIEAQIAINALLRAFPNLRLAHGMPERQNNLSFRGWKKLPLAL